MLYAIKKYIYIYSDSSVFERPGICTIMNAYLSKNNNKEYGSVFCLNICGI